MMCVNFSNYAIHFVWQNNKAVKLQCCGAVYSLLENVSDVLTLSFYSTSILHH